MTNPTHTQTLGPELFELGAISVTPGVLELADQEQINLPQLLGRHANGDWGDLPAEDWQANEEALRNGARLFSSYPVSDGEKVWIITDADTTACGPCWTGRSLCPGGGHFEHGTHFLDGPRHRLTTTILRPEDY